MSENGWGPDAKDVETIARKIAVYRGVPPDTKIFRHQPYRIEVWGFEYITADSVEAVPAWVLFADAAGLALTVLHEQGRLLIAPDAAPAEPVAEDQTVAWDHDAQVRDRAAEYFSELGLK